MNKKDLAEYYGKRVKVVCTDGNEYEGVFHSFINAEDNEPEKDEIGIKTETMGLQGVYTEKIHSIKKYKKR